MATRTFRNGDVHRRVWNDLTDPLTGTTLALDPGEERELEVPRGFTDPHLVTDEPEPPFSVRRRKAEQPTDPPVDGGEQAPAVTEEVEA